MKDKLLLAVILSHISDKIISDFANKHLYLEVSKNQIGQFEIKLNIFPNSPFFHLEYLVMHNEIIYSFSYPTQVDEENYKYIENSIIEFLNSLKSEERFKDLIVTDENVEESPGKHDKWVEEVKKGSIPRRIPMTMVGIGVSSKGSTSRVL